MDFPQVKGDPLDEYSDLKLFAGAFPWLFPGGIGDWVDNYTNESTRIDICLERLIRYEDGRFERDRMFPFYANDFIQRKLSNNNAAFFVKHVCGNLPQSLQDLKNDIDNGNYSFINKLLYFNGSLKGTDSYWRRKK